MLLNTKKLLKNVLDVTEMTFLMKKAMFHPLKQNGMCLDGGSRRILLSKRKCFITLYNYIYIHYTYKYVSYTHFTVYVEVCVCFEIVTLTSGVSFFVRCAPVMLFMRTQICIMTWV